MRLDSARELKLGLVRLARSRTLALVTSAGQRLGLTAQPPRASVPAIARGGVAFGISPKPGRGGGYRLAVRVMNRGAGWWREVLRRIPSLGEPEIEWAEGVRYAPRLRRMPRLQVATKSLGDHQVLKAGGSCGHPNITAGTLGGFVEDARRYYALSNNHVLADCDAASVGDAIWQPGPYDMRQGRHQVIAHLSRWIPLDPARTDGLDAAIAELDGEVHEFLPFEYAGIGELDPRVITDRYAVTRVIKRGRTTGVTRGKVSAFELDGVQLDYGTRLESRIITFDDQLEFVHVDRRRAFSQGGDSGSLIIDQATRRPYALLYGGGPDAAGVDRTLAHFLPPVLARLRVQMVTP